MKRTFRLTALFGCVLMLAAMVFSGIPASAASAKTERFLDPFDETSYKQVDGHWTFTKAYKYNVKLPDNYDVDMAKIDGNGGVFGFNPNKPALAAFMTNRTMTLFNEVYGSYTRTANLMKNYVAVETEIIYYFENGFESFEFMGIGSSDSGVGNWSGAFGMEEDPPLEIAYSDSPDGNWKTMNYKDMRVMPSGEASTSCYFCNTDKNTSDSKPTIPTSARYLRIKFLNGATYNEQTKEWDTKYENWQCVLGYLLVNEYTEPQSGSSGGSSGGSSITTGGSTSSGTSGTSSDSSTATDSSQDTDISSDTGSTDEITSDMTQSEIEEVIANSDGEIEKFVSYEIYWPVTGPVIGAGVLAVAAIIVAIVLYKKKVNDLTKIK